MCLIISKEDQSVIPQQYIENAYESNNHGFGLMWVEDGRLKTQKGIYRIPYIRKLFSEFMNRPFAAHFRFATGGTISRDNAHPFQILSREEHGIDLAMMHNGVIRQIQYEKGGRSDTAIFIEEFLRPILSKNPDLISDTQFQKVLEDAIGYGNKLLFMDHTGKTTIVNKTAGQVRDGIWYSNGQSFYTPYYTGSYNKNRKVRDDLPWDDVDTSEDNTTDNQTTETKSSVDESSPSAGKVSVVGDHGYASYVAPHRLQEYYGNNVELQEEMDAELNRHF